MDSNLPLLGVVSFMFVVNFSRYFLMAGGAYAFFWKWKANQFQNRKIQTRTPKAAEIKNEIFYSLCTMFVFLLAGVYLYFMRGTPFNKIYFKMDEHGVSYFVFSIAALLVLHDTYFYWAHRLMHVRWLYPYVHQVHHRSITPTPWASFSFHPSEAVLEAAIIPLVVAFFPVHFGAIVIFQFISFFYNVLGHLGVELAFPSWVHHPVMKWINTSYHHNLHHQKFTTNYGLYFNYWDRLLGTQDAHYEQGFDQIKARATREKRLSGVA